MTWYLGVIGGAKCTEEEMELAEEVGREIALRGAILICGGRGGVMEAASRGARLAGGTVVGILPGRRREEGNPYLSIAIPTGLGDARNAIIACAADALVAIGGGYGTLSEIGLALKMKKPVIGLFTWKLERPGLSDGLPLATSAREAVDMAIMLISAGKENHDAPYPDR
ncbi:TIGR00725 family protein [Desulfofundulus thermocisternus]|uniref:TIGR00725 family protein n=1 Tax=Desulfofundulus thermocisternus TaxID=42471 RepID=UPI001A04A3D7|nr:TIGR00725 family protein [Desulfofundulus thermocisternus]MBE3585803.1 TIGR00725 family protein [Thermoanaerobacter sp.]MCS5696389.1 TIGR00725 family protein [Desulfofundulus thermocisternus]